MNVPALSLKRLTNTPHSAGLPTHEPASLSPPSAAACPQRKPVLCLPAPPARAATPLLAPPAAPPPLITPMDFGCASAVPIKTVLSTENGCSGELRALQRHAKGDVFEAFHAAVRLNAPLPLWVPDAVPEVAMLHDAPAVLPQGSALFAEVLAKHGNPAWLRAWRAAEPTHLQGDALLAQQNRVAAMGRYLILLRAAHISWQVAEHVAELVPLLMAVPHVQARHALVRMVALFLMSASHGDREALLAAVRAGKSPESKELLLAAALSPHPIMRTPGVQALFEARVICGNGLRARRLLAWLVDEQRISSEVSRVLGWGHADNLLPMLQNETEESPTQTLAASMLASDGTYASATPSEKKAAWQQARLDDALRSEVLHAALRDRHGRGVVTLVDQGAWMAESRRLSAALVWCGQDPQLCAALKVGAPDALKALVHHDAELCANNPWLPHAPKTVNALLAQVRALPKSPRKDWAVELLVQLQRHVSAPVIALSSRSVVDKCDLSSAFYAHKAVRQFINQRVAPMTLALQQFYPLVRDNGAHRTPHALIRACVPWIEGDDVQKDLDKLNALMPKFHNVAEYLANMSTWQTSVRQPGEAALHRVIAAVRGGTYTELRRQSPQMRALATWENLPAWEAGHSALVPSPEGPGTWRVYDTDNVGDSLDAMNQVHSCQSVNSAGTLNVGNLARFLDGSKRLVVLRDQQGTVRGRAILRLMNDDRGRPVLGLSTVRTYKRADAGRQPMRQFVLDRAAALGIAVVSTARHENDGTYIRANQGVYGSHFETAVRSLPAELPDYWDEAGGIREDTVTLAACPRLARAA